MNNQRPSSLAVGERKNRIVVRGTGAGKRKNKTLSQKVTLERVLGITVKDNCTLTCDPNTGHVAYVAGCVIVVFNPRRNKQFHIFNQSKKTLTALSFSGDGRYLVSGECGHNPAVRIWDVQDKTQVAEFHGHKYGISCVRFSPDMQYVVSIGEQHDMVVNVWDWKKNIKHSSGKIAAQVTGLAFSEDGSFFVAVGNRCVKFYYLMGKSRTRQIQALPGRSGILGEQRNNFFVSVACGKGENQDKVYAITRSGFLCELNSKRLLDKWVELRTTGAHSITADEEFIFVACDGGIIRLFNASTLHFIATLPKPHYLGVNVSAGIDASHMSSHRDNAQYPDAIALMFDSENKKLTCVYNDHSLYIWDIHDVKKIGKQYSFLYHSACIFGVETYPELSDGSRAALPAGSFFTCSSDGTIRIWNMDPTMNTTVLKRNIYSHELLKVLYVGEDSLENLQDRDIHTSAQGDKTDMEKGKTGIRCMRVSPDGQMLASGDRSGNVRVHDLQFWDQLHEIEAHDSEVLCLEYTQPNTGYNLLASASRDRLIHVFDMDKNCSLVQTLDDHSSSITSVKFNRHGEQLQMISCGADKALMFRIAVYNPDLQFVRNHHVVNKTTLYDLAIDTTQKYITTACQDRNLRIYNIVSGKLKRTYKGAQSDEGTLIRVELDPSGIYAATSCSDKSLSIYDFYSGECVATMMGHSELVTGIKFTSDCKQLISVAGDGCIFIWKLPWELTHNMKERLKEMGEKVIEPPPEYNMLRRGTYVVPPELPPEPKARVISAWQTKPAVAAEFQPAMQSRPDTEDETDDREPDEDSTTEECNFETGLLPLWAQKQVKAGEDIPDVPSPTKYSSPTHPRGRWAQNINSGGIKVKSQMEELNQSIELRLEDCLDRRRYTVEPDVLLEQVRPFANRSQGPFAGMDAEEIAKICGEEFVPASEKFGLLSQEEFEESEKMDGFVTTSRGSDPRGSDPFGPPPSLRASAADSTHGANGIGHPGAAENGDGTKVDDIEGDDEEEEEDEEEKEDDAPDKEIIFYPPEEEEESSPESLKFQVTESTKSHEELAKRHSRHKSKEGSKETISSDPTPNKDLGVSATSSTDGNEEEDVDESDDEEEEEEEEEEERGTVTPTASPRRSKLTSIEPPSPTTTPDEEKFLHTNFSFAEKEKNIGDFTEQENFGKCLEQLQSKFSDEISCGRLSISSRFLSRSQHSIARVAPMMSQTPSAGISPEEYLRRRKEEVARAVEETRKRLTSLGWNMGDKKTANVPTAATSGPGGAKVKPAIPPRQSKPVPRKVDQPLTELPGDKDTSATPVPVQTDSVLTSKDKKDDASVEDASVNGHSMSGDVGVKGQTESIPKDGSLDKNRHASKESSHESSPETSGNAKDQKTKEKSSDSLKNVKNNALDEALDDIFKDNKSPKHLIRQTSVSSDDTSSSCDFEAEVDSNKENVSSVALLNKKKHGEEDGSGVPNTKSMSGGDRSKIAGKKTNMRRVASLTDLRKDNLDKNESSPTLTPPTQSSHARSSSSERARKQQSPSDSPARQKRREKADRMLPLLPTPKTRSYEGRTESSMAKVVRRISESPPPSPNTRRKKMSLGGATMSKSGPLKATDSSLISDTKSDIDLDLNSEASFESSKASEDGSSTTSKKTTSSDKLAMPPPTSTHVSKAKGRKMSNTKMADRGRKRSSSVTLTPGTCRGRRSSTSSLPPSTSESKAKSTDSKSKIPMVNAKPAVPSRSPKATTDSKSEIIPKQPAKIAKDTHTGQGAQADSIPAESESSKEARDVNKSSETPIGNEETVDEVVKRGERDEEKESDKSSSVSEDTMVLESTKVRTTLPQEGDEQRKPVEGLTTSGGNTPEEVKAMRADLTIDLDDITVDGTEVDPGVGLRRSVDAMKKAFDQCINYVSLIERKGNHRQDLNYFSSTFANMDKSYDTRVLHVVRRSNNASPENTLSNASEGCLNISNSGQFTETSRSLPSLSDLMGGPSVDTRERLDKRSGSLDASSPQALAMLQHYSDMLVNMVRSKMDDSEDGLLSGRSRVSSLDLEGED
ncbi:mitogen-activated protein kinase-binding protein 1-like isoform X3 [Lytechinus variegatus]|uniref:mitogen-activated protein kinase-binding protein 1-like isoform X3 n=1 Tax=Lytechinus variegatus TaxID=7654 RepID=UPI001BB1D404|nr:mitogen-activated protein kinase-binding protein 1-like isoform X3 [Lytechinus variegatus]